MRRFLLTALLLMTLGMGEAFAQLHYTSKVSIGAKGGITMSQMSFTPGTKQKMVQGKTAGITMKYWEERNFGFIAELNYEQRGWQEDFEGAPYSFERHLDYIQIPIMTSFFFGGNVVKGFFNAGPEVGYLVGTSYKANFDVNNISQYPDFPDNRMTDQLWMKPSRKFDYGITGGAGVEVAIRRKHIISLEARYYFGIGNIFPDDRADTFSASRTTSIMVTLGYSYRLK